MITMPRLEEMLLHIRGKRLTVFPYGLVVVFLSGGASFPSTNSIHHMIVDIPQQTV
jgi:hypothetical protein